jgi:hypothetical protein
MLTAAFALLTLAVVAGTVLGFLHLRETGAAHPPVAAGLAHGAVGAIGLALLFPIALGPPRGAAEGAAVFGPVSAWLLAAALAAGMGVLLRRRHGSGVTMAIHVGIAITGYTVLLAWYLVG